MTAAAVVMLGFLLAGRAFAGFSPGAACERAAYDASARAGLPPGLLRAVGLVESGHFDPTSGVRTPWPYAVDADGAGHWFADRAAAADFVRSSLASGARAVDVGCFQINLQDHPDAFATLHEAFDPSANATYAAEFLGRLHARLGSWRAAIAAYHSATPALGLPYARQVQAAWHDATFASRGAGSAPSLGAGDRYVIHLGPSLRALPRIVTP